MDRKQQDDLSLTENERGSSVSPLALGLGVLAMILLFSGIHLVRTGSGRIDSIIHGGYFVLVSCLAGILLTAGLGFVIRCLYPRFYGSGDPEQPPLAQQTFNILAVVHFGLSLAVVAPFAVEAVNRGWDGSEVRSESIPLNSKGYGRGRYSDHHYYLHLTARGVSTRIAVPKAFYDSVEPGDRLSVRSRSGALGFAYLTGIGREIPR